MKCEKHPEVEMKDICGDPSCGMCFADSMVGARKMSTGGKDPEGGWVEFFKQRHIDMGMARSTKK